MVLRLVKVSEKDLPSVLEAIEEYRNDTSEFGRESSRSLVEAANTGSLSEWIVGKQEGDQEINLKPGYVGQTSYWLMDDKEYIGSISLRHELNDQLMIESGHIGYFIRPSKRRKGYAFTALSLCLVEARKRGIKQVLITCNIKNEGSYAVMKKALNTYGGEILPDSTVEDVVYHRVWINTIDKINTQERKNKERKEKC